MKPLPFAAGLALFAAPLALETELSHWGEHGAQPALAAGLTLLMATWWISEALPIAWTACVPLVVLPLAKIYGDGFGANLRGAVAPYLDPYNFLFLGGMGIAAAMQQWGLHRRIALQVMRVVGTDARRLLFGLLLATATVSLWISNTATAAMMFPIGLALIVEFEHEGGRRLAGYGAALMLAVAYGSNVGGIGTKIGTVPSAQLSGFLAQRGVEVSFLEFAAIGMPFVLLFLPIVWLALWRIGRADAPAKEVGERALAGEGARLGAIGRAEKVVLCVFLATAAVWVMGKPITDLLRAQGLPELASARRASRCSRASAISGVGGSVLSPVARFVHGRPRAARRLSRFRRHQASGLSLARRAARGARAVPPLRRHRGGVVTVALSAFASNAAFPRPCCPCSRAASRPSTNRVLFAALPCATSHCRRRAQRDRVRLGHLTIR